jgi:hypothetical protein
MTAATIPNNTVSTSAPIETHKSVAAIGGLGGG